MQEGSHTDCPGFRQTENVDIYDLQDYRIILVEILNLSFIFKCRSKYTVKYFSAAVRSRLPILIFGVHSVLMEGSAGGVERGGIELHCV